jgi:hypothetical protein
MKDCQICGRPTTVLILDNLTGKRFCFECAPGLVFEPVSLDDEPKPFPLEERLRELKDRVN